MSDSFEPDILELMLNDFGVLNKPMVRPLRNLHELREVYRLTHDCYVASGYSAAHTSGMTIHYPSFDHLDQTTILIAMMHGKIVGSFSLTEDGPGGLSIDEDFKDACDAIRQEGRPVGAVWRLVVQESVRTQRTIVISLINAMIELMARKGLSNALFAVNPKHESVYKRMLDGTVVARCDSTHGLANAPSVLLRVNPTELHRERVLLPRSSSNPIHLLLTTSPY